jgi:hypothetical protein
MQSSKGDSGGSICTTELMRRAYEFHPGMWTKIAAIVDRTEQDCRDRWNKEIVNSEKRNTG